MAKILVIDDERQHREHAAKILREAGFEVQASDGGEAELERVTAAVPDLILCDAVMPEVTGYGVLGKVRSDARFRDVPFVLLTALSIKGVREEAMRQGVQGFLHKPYKTEDLLAMIRGLLAKVESARVTS